MAKYGITYQGSKDGIAESIISFLPSGKRFVDLFGGGYAISDCAERSGKYEGVYYNEINPLLVETIKSAINGDYNLDHFKPEFVNFDTFHKLKDNDGFIKYFWSFSGNGLHYYLMKRLQSIAAEGYNYVVFGKTIEGLPLKTDGTIRQRRIWLKRKTKREFEKIIKTEPQLLNLYKEYQAIINGKTKAGKKLAAQFGAWLRTTGITPKEINKLTGTFMASHYLCDKEDGQPAIPTEEQWAKLKQSPKLKNIPKEIELLCDSEKRIDQLLKQKSEAQKEKMQRLGNVDRLEMLKRLERLENLERLEPIERLERAERLEHLRGNKNITINCGSYTEYEYREGDVVYCDIPYEGTEGYSGESFDFKAFYDWAASRPYQVFFSSYSNISDKRFKMVWAKPKRSQMNGARTVKYNYECIYTNKVE